MRRQLIGLLALALAAAPLAGAAQAQGAGGHEGHAAPGSHPGHGSRAYGDKLGTVEFPVSCDEEAARELARGLALLHHMTYEGAREVFAAAAAADPDCAMAYWGQAMTFIHPLWSDPPSEEDFERGKAFLATAGSRGEKTARERAYIAAAEAYYQAGWNRNEKANLASFEEGWQAVHEGFSDDPEAAALYALAHLATADPGDKTYAKQKRSGAIAAEILARSPDHPGGHHYLIHSYDYPPLAEQALAAARRYGENAPAVPHALHMPTHIFTRLGLWEESITMNERSATAALEHPAGDQVSLHFHHALDYVVYAHLQMGNDAKAEEVASTLAGVEGPFQTHLAAAYTLAAVPARIALERQRWVEAAALEPRTPADYPWDTAPAIEAITHFARAIGGARSGKPEVARQALERLAVLRDEAAKGSPYWAKQVEIQRLAGQAWLEFATGKKEEGLATMRAAAELEATTEKHPVTPGEVLPARELLADMLLEAERPEEALAAYQATLERSPKRFNALYGAARAAERAGDRAAAERYFQALVEVAGEASGRSEPMARAREFLAGRPSD